MNVFKSNSYDWCAQPYMNSNITHMQEMVNEFNEKN